MNEINECYQKQVDDRLNREIKEAAQFVATLLPQELDGPIHTRHFYESSSELGGDCFYYQWLNPDCFVFYGVDVAGHGICSALLSVSILNALNAYMKLQPGLFTPHDALEMLNEAFPMAKQGNRFSTAWLGMYRPSHHMLEYVCAGYPPPFFLRREHEMDMGFLSTRGFPLGILPNQKYQSRHIRIEPGDCILLFSDGIYESQVFHGSPGSYESFAKDVLASYQNEQAPLEAIQKKYLTKINGRPFRDDLTLVELQFHE